MLDLPQNSCYHNKKAKQFLFIILVVFAGVALFVLKLVLMKRFVQFIGAQIVTNSLVVQENLFLELIVLYNLLLQEVIIMKSEGISIRSHLNKIRHLLLPRQLWLCRQTHIQLMINLLPILKLHLDHNSI